MTSGREEQNLWWKVGLAVVWPFYRLVFRLRVVGAERIPGDGPGILAANHVSVMDPPVLALTGARRGRTVHFLATHQLFDLRVVGWALRSTGQIPVRRGEQDSGALDDAIATIRSGGLAGIFPEGKVNPDPETMLPGHRGVARMALPSGAPVIPVGIWGTQRRWPHAGLRIGLPLRPKLVVSVGEPLDPVGAPESMDDIRAFTDLVMRRIGEERNRARWEAGS